MHFTSSFLAFVVCSAHLAYASPTAPARQRRDNLASTTPVSADVINSDFLRPAQLTRLVYCSSPAVQAMNCGEPCDELGAGTLEVLQTGGDGGRTPRFYVAFDNSTQSIVVAHEGTRPANPLSVINNLKLDLQPLDTTLFPKADGSVLVHHGFAETQARTADAVLSAVQSAIASKGVNKVFVTGHSLGAAISTLDALMLSMRLDESVQVSSTTFGTPRGGNQAFADLIDSTFGSAYTFITRGKDPVPRIPSEALSYRHSSGEVYMVSETETVACPGQENENCINKNSIKDVSIPDHFGPYFGGLWFEIHDSC